MTRPLKKDYAISGEHCKHLGCNCMCKDIIKLKNLPITLSMQICLNQDVISWDDDNAWQKHSKVATLINPIVFWFVCSVNLDYFLAIFIFKRTYFGSQYWSISL